VLPPEPRATVLRAAADVLRQDRDLCPQWNVTRDGIPGRGWKTRRADRLGHPARGDGARRRRTRAANGGTRGTSTGWASSSGNASRRGVSGKATGAQTAAARPAQATAARAARPAGVQAPVARAAQTPARQAATTRAAGATQAARTLASEQQAGERRRAGSTGSASRGHARGTGRARRQRQRARRKRRLGKQQRRRKPPRLREHLRRKPGLRERRGQPARRHR
jgi:hypothetical protein